MFSVSQLPGQSSCGGLFFGTVLPDISGYRVDVDYSSAPSCFSDMEIHVRFTGQPVTIDFSATNASTGSGYSAVQQNSQTVKFVGSPSSFSSGTMGTIYFDLSGSGCTQIEFFIVANILCDLTVCDAGSTFVSGPEIFCTATNLSIEGEVAPAVGSSVLSSRKVLGSAPAATSPVDDFTASNDYDLTISSGLAGEDWTVEVDDAYEQSNPATAINCGVSTLDISLLTKHILQTQPFTDGWQHVAGDASNNGILSSFDRIVIQRTILNQPNGIEFYSQSWQYPTPDDLTDIENSTTISEASFTGERLVPNLLTDQNGIDFVAVKVGDVNATCASYSLMADPPVLAKTARTVWLDAATTAVGENLLVPVTIADFDYYDVFALSLSVDPAYLQLNGIEAGTIAPQVGDNFTVDAGSGQLQLIWSPDTEQKGISLAADSALFYLSLRVLQPVEQLAQLIELAENGLENRYYPTQPETEPSTLELAWRNKNLAKRAGTGSAPGLRLTSANPFRDHLDFIVDRASRPGQISFELFDGSGRLVVDRTGITAIEGSTLRIEGLSHLPTGPYHYRFIDRKAGDILLAGTLVKQ